MSVESGIAFIQAVKTNPDLKQKLKGLKGTSKEAALQEAVSIANQAGFDVTANDLTSALADVVTTGLVEANMEPGTKIY